jgi:hypothetical protein
MRYLAMETVEASLKRLWVGKGEVIPVFFKLTATP